MGDMPLGRPIEVGSIAYHAVRAKGLAEESRHKAFTGWNTDALNDLAEAIIDLSLAVQKVERVLQEKGDL